MPTCPQCQQETGPGDAFCPHCGAPLTASPASPPPPPPPPPGAEAITREQWSAYLGKNGDYYLTQFAKFNLGGVDTFSATWNWAAFLASFWWFLYRKLYLWFALALVGMFIPYLRYFVWVACGLAGNYLYYLEAKRQIQAFRNNNPDRDITDMLAQAGGVHAWVVPVAIAVSIALFLLMFVLMAFMGGMAMGVFYKMYGHGTF